MFEEHWKEFVAAAFSVATAFLVKFRKNIGEALSADKNIRLELQKMNDNLQTLRSGQDVLHTGQNTIMEIQQTHADKLDAQHRQLTEQAIHYQWLKERLGEHERRLLQVEGRPNA